MKGSAGQRWRCSPTPAWHAAQQPLPAPLPPGARCRGLPGPGAALAGHTPEAWRGVEGWQAGMRGGTSAQQRGAWRRHATTAAEAPHLLRPSPALRPPLPAPHRTCTASCTFSSANWMSRRWSLSIWARSAASSSASPAAAALLRLLAPCAGGSFSTASTFSWIWAARSEEGGTGKIGLGWFVAEGCTHCGGATLAPPWRHPPAAPPLPLTIRPLVQVLDGVEDAVELRGQGGGACQGRAQRAAVGAASPAAAAATCTKGACSTPGCPY